MITDTKYVNKTKLNAVFHTLHNRTILFYGIPSVIMLYHHLEIRKNPYFIPNRSRGRSQICSRLVSWKT